MKQKKWLTSNRQSWASCDELQEESLLLCIEAAQNLKQEPNCTAAEKSDEIHIKHVEVYLCKKDV